MDMDIATETWSIRKAAVEGSRQRLQFCLEPIGTGSLFGCLDIFASNHPGGIPQSLVSGLGRRERGGCPNTNACFASVSLSVTEIVCHRTARLDSNYKSLQGGISDFVGFLLRR